MRMDPFAREAGSGRAVGRLRNRHNPADARMDGYPGLGG